MEQLQFEPMGIGGILDRSFRLYKQSFIRFIAIVAIVKIPIALLAFLLISAQVEAMLAQATQGPSAAAGAAKQLGYVVIATGLLAGIAHLLSSAALIRAVSGSYLGRSLSVGQSYSGVVGKLLPLIGVVIVLTLLMIPIVIVGMIVAAIAAANHWLLGVLVMVVSAPV